MSDFLEKALSRTELPARLNKLLYSAKNPVFKTVGQIYISLSRAWINFFIFRFQDGKKRFWDPKDQAAKLFSVTLTLQILFSLTAWIGYDMNFGIGKVHLSTSVKPNLYFILLAGINFILMEIIPGLFTFFLFILLQIISGTLLVSGILYPNPVFTDFIRAEDYYFRPFFYLYILVFIINPVLAIMKIRKL